MAKKIILDVDTGTDDAVAIAVAALSPEVEILGITVTHGNQPLSYTVENTLRVVEFLGIDVPVYPGCPEPMVQYMTPGRLQNVRRQTTRKVVDGEEITIHQKYLDLPAAAISPADTHACSYLIDTLKHAGEKITLVPVGPLTNIGMALRMDPSIADHIEEIVIMGGGITRGNRTPVAEANFYDDPEAAQIVFSSGCPIRVLPLEATERVLFGPEDAAEFRSLSRTGAFVADLIDSFIHRCRLLGILSEETICIHDAITVCAVIDPAVITDLRRKNCDVDFSGGFADGQLVIDDRTFIAPTDRTYIAYDVDRERCVRIIREALGRGKKEE